MRAFCPPPTLVVDDVVRTPEDDIIMAFHREGDMGTRRFVTAGGGLQSRVAVYDAAGNLRASAAIPMGVLHQLQGGTAPVSSTYAFATPLPTPAYAVVEAVVEMSGAYALAPMSFALPATGE